MGGGAAMRAAAKAAGITVVNGGRRVFSAENYPISSSASRVAAASSSSGGVAAEDLKLVASQSHNGVERAFADLDDWIFAGEEEEEESADLMPRVVFSAPTVQEAKEATSDLADALEKTYLNSPNSVGVVGVDNESGLSLSNSRDVVKEVCVTSENAVVPVVSGHAIKAFKLLNESSAAQNVVASIACDPNVWNAVLQNQELQEFLHSQRTSATSSNMNLVMEELVADSDLIDQPYAKSVADSSDDVESEPHQGFGDFIQKIKGTVVDMMGGLYDYFQNFFGGQGSEKVFVNSDGTARSSAETVMEASFMGLAVMAILVILLKRT